MKQLTILTGGLLASLFLAPQLHAEGESMKKKHVYAFGGIGMNSGNYKSNYDDPVVIGEPAHIELGKTRFAGLLGFGGGVDMGCAHLGAELSILLNSVKAESRIENPAAIIDSKVSVKDRSVWGLHAMGGYYLSKDKKPLVYVLLGATRHKIKGEAWVNAVGGPRRSVIGKSKNITAFSPGLGFKYFVTPKMNVGIEWRASFGRKVTLYPDTGSAFLKVRPTTHAVMIKVGGVFRT